MNASKCLIRAINTVLLGLTFAWLGSVDTVRAQSGVWTAKGPAGQEVLALAIDPLTPTTLYAGTRTGGVFKSIDAGENWTAVNNGLPSAFVGALVIDPRTPTTLYGMSLGIVKTVDGGASWTQVSNGIHDSQLRSLVSLAIDPMVPTTLYVGTQGLLYKTTDGGDSWTSGGLFSPISAVAIDPLSSTVYVATHSNGTNPRIRKSVDGGATWIVTALDRNMVYTLAIDPEVPTTLYAGTCKLDSSRCGVVKSLDGGDSWADMADGLPVDGVVRALAIDPQTPATIYAGVTNRDYEGFGVFKSPDGGGSWVAINEGLTNNLDVMALAVDPGNSAIVYAGTRSGGVFARTGEPEFMLSVGTTGIGRGTVTSSPGGIACGSDCSEPYVSATAVTLTATPALGSIFTGWSGCDAVSGSRCTVVMRGERSVNANFVGIPIGIGPSTASAAPESSALGLHNPR